MSLKQECIDMINICVIKNLKKQQMKSGFHLFKNSSILTGKSMLFAPKSILIF